MMGYVIAPSARVALAALLAAPLAAACVVSPARAQSNNVRVTQLDDMAFGFVSGPGDQQISDNVCVFAHTVNDRYAVIATGSGGSGAFVITSVQDSLTYEVQWSGSPNQSGGTSLVAGVTSPTFTSGATHQTCRNGPTTSASLTVVLRAAELDRVTAGSYSGTLQITIVPN